MQSQRAIFFKRKYEDIKSKKTLNTMNSLPPNGKKTIALPAPIKESNEVAMKNPQIEHPAPNIPLEIPRNAKTLLRPESAFFSLIEYIKTAIFILNKIAIISVQNVAAFLYKFARKIIFAQNVIDETTAHFAKLKFQNSAANDKNKNPAKIA